MIKELRKMRAQGGKEKALANYVSALQNRGLIKMYFTPKGYIAYDTAELAKYKKTVKIGRPAKIKETAIIGDIKDVK